MSNVIEFPIDKGPVCDSCGEHHDLMYLYCPCNAEHEGPPAPVLVGVKVVRGRVPVISTLVCDRCGSQYEVKDGEIQFN